MTNIIMILCFIYYSPLLRWRPGLSIAEIKAEYRLIVLVKFLYGMVVTGSEFIWSAMYIKNQPQINLLHFFLDRYGIITGTQYLELRQLLLAGSPGSGKTI